MWNIRHHPVNISAHDVAGIAAEAIGWPQAAAMPSFFKRNLIWAAAKANPLGRIPKHPQEISGPVEKSKR